MNYYAMLWAYLVLGVIFMIWVAPELIGQFLAALCIWLAWPIWFVAGFAATFAHKAPRFVGRARGARRG